MPFSWVRTIHFGDTDAAGVVFFARYLQICHEAYEEALAAAGIDLGRFFSDTGSVVPIAKAEIDFLRPLRAGEKVTVTVIPRRLTDNSFELRYEMVRATPPLKRAALARTEHVCIRSDTRERMALPDALAAFVKTDS